MMTILIASVFGLAVIGYSLLAVNPRNDEDRASTEQVTEQVALPRATVLRLIRKQQSDWGEIQPLFNGK